MRKPPAWVDPMMRVGFTARGVVYLLVGALALVAVKDGGSTPDSATALGALLGQPFGRSLMALVVAGLVAYAVWSFVQGVLDLDAKGNDAKGWVIRAAQLISGAVHLSLAVSVLPLVLGKASGASGDRTEHWRALLMQQPLGRLLVAVVGVLAIGIGVQHFIKIGRAVGTRWRDGLRYAVQPAGSPGVNAKRAPLTPSRCAQKLPPWRPMSMIMSRA